MKTSTYEPEEQDDVSIETFDSNVSDPQPEYPESVFARVTPSYYHHSNEPAPEVTPSYYHSNEPSSEVTPSYFYSNEPDPEVTPTYYHPNDPAPEVTPSDYHSNDPPEVTQPHAHATEPPPEEAPSHTHSTEPPPVPKRSILPPSEPETSSQPLQEILEVTEVDVQSGYRDIELVSPEDIIVQRTEANSAERWSDTTSVSLPGQIEDIETVASDTDPANAQCDPVSEMYYTASSEVSLLSDTELPDKGQTEDEEKDKDDRKNVIAGHVAAMRERFESMTRTSTPCPDLIRSLSPSLEVFRNSSPSPDRLA